MLKKVLVANRGEIALRIIRAARELGIKTVAIYSEADRWKHYVSQADEAYLTGPPEPKDSYLNLKKIIGIAKSTKADSIHPGYGFLSENPVFAQECRRNKLTFIGPTPEAMKKIGNKITARELAIKNDIKVTPGINGEVTLSDVKRFAKKFGYPVLVKAAKGGGGRGMRVIRNEKEIASLLSEARNEVSGAFGGSSLFVEKYIEKPRHIEIQILGDKLGKVVDLFERECSIQRRHQKLVEESPSPALNERKRKEITSDARKIAELAGYTNAGTVEFLLDKEGNHYFQEVNSRLQVEHPVTEMVTGIDIVKEQFKISAGEKLDIKRKFSGCAIECRILAEDPYSNFAPSIGKILSVSFPRGHHIRIDTDLLEGDIVSPHYDSLLAKLIVWGKDRGSATAQMLNALEAFILVGVDTTIPFHVALFQSARFKKADYHTTFIEKDFKIASVEKNYIETASMLAATLEFTSRESSFASYKSSSLVSAWKRAIQETE